MPFTPINVVNGSTAANATWGNNVQVQYTEATSSFNQDEYTPYILSGLIASKDSVTASKLDITAGVAYVLQSDNTTRRRAVASTSQTTSALSSTYYLYLQPDGSLYWATTNTPAANSLFLAQVTTDSSGNISGVTDKRTLSTTLFSGKDANLGALTLPAPLSLRLSQNGALAGAVNGGVTFGGAGAVQNDLDTSAAFNGSTGYIAAPGTGLPTGNGVYSMEAWFNVAAAPASFYVLMQFGGAGTSGSANLYMDNTGKLNFETYGNASILSNAALTGGWHHIVGTWDGTTQRMYVDGVAQTATATPGAGALTSGFCFLATQSNGSAMVNFLNGSLAKCAIYNSALSSTRITAHYNARTGGGYDAAVLADAPLRYYRLADAAGATWAADTISPTVSSFSDAGGNLSPAGRLTTLGGQQTAGSFGAPVIVAQALQVHVTATTLQTILSWTPPAAGLYQVQMHISYGNNTTQNPQAKCSYFDPNLGNPSFAFMGAGNNIVLGGSYTATANVTIATLPMTIYAGTGGPITLTYQDPAGTPSDYIQAMIIRLA